MVITGLTRNQVALTGSWVRIPPLPPAGNAPLRIRGYSVQGRKSPPVSWEFRQARSFCANARPESAVILYKGESLRPYLGSLCRLDPFVRTPCSEFAVILYKGESLCPYLGSFVRLDPFVRTRRSEYAVILYNGESLCPYLGSLCRLDPFVQTRRPESRPGRTDGAGSFPGNRGNTI